MSTAQPDRVGVLRYLKRHNDDPKAIELTIQIGSKPFDTKWIRILPFRSVIYTQFNCQLTPGA